MANTVNIRKWVEALRSGDYQQGTGHLRAGDKYCCLGVACELAIQDGVPVKVRSGLTSCTHLGDEDHPNQHPHNGSIYEYNSEGGVLPRAVADWLGLNDMPLVRTEGHGYRALTELNDGLGWDFAKLADAIERDWLTEVAL